MVRTKEAVGSALVLVSSLSLNWFTLEFKYSFVTLVSIKRSARIAFVVQNPSILTN